MLEEKRTRDSHRASVSVRRSIRSRLANNDKGDGKRLVSTLDTSGASLRMASNVIVSRKGEGAMKGENRDRKSVECFSEHFLQASVREIINERMVRSGPLDRNTHREENMQKKSRKQSKGANENMKKTDALREPCDAPVAQDLYKLCVRPPNTTLPDAREDR
ncbi:uncharacterized protein BT62DRAFT_1010834 [Guyanagaster necrorhizus]|uniref:Uncharacterized protein n=1 Tax=Guyanagaster necrorhizus TaxID=856835 RepID=A0A9P7VLD9_9AGAR|nr:uncharacterized protein BT62DRAFT_1010834 [Guyanagaster necrorhizus MCA 3950]KAG7442049.1 hypothetical protein BT62DRAFT_1010834 [Guyanagaster necrorhizus MCA 3950]